MALYEFKCNDCGKVAEHLVFGDDKPVCPDCGSKNMEKMMSTFAVSMASGASAAPPPSSCNTGCCGGSCGL